MDFIACEGSCIGQQIGDDSFETVGVNVNPECVGPQAQTRLVRSLME